MQVLEKILEEINKKIEAAEKIIVEPPHDELDRIANDTAEAFIEAYKECQEIIHSNIEKGDSIQHCDGKEDCVHGDGQGSDAH